MERNDIENIRSNQSNQCSYGGAKRSGRGGAHGGGAGLHPSQFFPYTYKEGYVRMTATSDFSDQLRTFMI